MFSTHQVDEDDGARTICKLFPLIISEGEVEPAGRAIETQVSSAVVRSRSCRLGNVQHRGRIKAMRTKYSVISMEPKRG